MTKVGLPVDSTVVSAGHVLTGTEHLSPGWVEVLGDRVSAVGRGAPPHRPDLELPAMTVVPGLVDTHVHGGGGASYSTESHTDALAVARAHAEHGTTTHVASLVTAPLDELARQVAALAELVDDGLLAGIHLEGPWLSPRFRGAHDVANLRSPDGSDVARLLDAGRGAIRMVTLAPELPGGLDAVRQVVAAGAVAAIGHTGADYQTARAAIAAGASVATHLFNAMPQVHHRDPGPVVALLEDETVAVELILDNHHLHPATAALAMRSSRGSFHLVTDAMAATGSADGRYRLGSRVVDVADGVATLQGTQTLAGSTLTMDSAVRGAVAAGASLLQAVRAATVLPAQHLQLPGVGQLAPGFRADLVLLDDELVVRRTMHAGRWLDPAAQES
jgi:N-acetylglucosamine-6-phosphate deacetylase